MLENISCRHLCTSSITPDNADFLSARIRDAYTLNWLIDGLPAAEMKQDEKTGEVFYSSGFSLGSAAPILPKGKKEPHDTKDWRTEINNHYQIYIEYHSRDGVHQRVVGVLVWPTTCVALPTFLRKGCSFGSPTVATRSKEQRTESHLVMWMSPTSYIWARRTTSRTRTPSCGG